MSTILDAVRLALGRNARSPLAPRPPIIPPRAAVDRSAEINLLLKEIEALSGVTARLNDTEIDSAVERLVSEHAVRRAALWSTKRLRALLIEDRLHRLGVEIVPMNADKHDLATCDLGVTEADFALPETGTLGLLSSNEKPRAVSLLPRVHLAILSEQALRVDLHDVFAEASNRPYLVFITGPSRTADIELTVTLGVHGPQALHVWIVD